MAISSDYSAPVRVNGFACRNCSEVDQAKRNIDPANPSAGPFGINDSKNHGKKAAENHFAADARQKDLMARLHDQQDKARKSPGSSVSSAYGLAAATVPGNFVNIAA